MEEECARSEETRAPFCVLRLDIENESSSQKVIEALSSALRMPDILAVYGPNRYEILLPNTSAELATALSQDLTDRLSSNGMQSKRGMACYGRDGRTPESLLAAACDRVADTHTAAAGSGVVIKDPRMLQLF